MTIKINTINVPLVRVVFFLNELHHGGALLLLCMSFMWLVILGVEHIQLPVFTGR